ncbi:hypothetical protein GCM10010156_76340 [Planobispora rosea]|uniref:DUF4136 domain-containing protein n=1 Tax=Planobispora rosea TaxID=35762 RepID=A0A8J3S6F3_PLARO|nr:hypothetical protein [Planobispora rosea]GGT07962.1 hypothetical protein GCM10010156_76340 [Planobispora rosea]GIH89171.1 hypothetical protein Pro02_75790 [Planobispora rosea]
MLILPAARRSRLRRTAAAAMTTLVLGALTACSAAEPAASGRSPASPSAGTHRLVLPPPPQAEGFRLDGMWPFFTREELLDKRPYIGDAGDVAVRDAVQARYEETEQAEGRKWTRNLIFTGYDAALGADRHRPVVDSVVDGFLKGDTPAHDAEVPAGPLGGHVRCVGLVELGSETGMCAWADGGTVGVVIGANITAIELEEALPAFRAAVER